MFSLHITNSILQFELTGLVPRLRIVIEVHKPDEAPVKVDVRVTGEVKK